MLTAITGINWGDEGKGRMVDLISQEYDIVARYQGGNNAGHTVKNERGKFVLNLLPSGILRPNVVCVMGNGMVIDPHHLDGEINKLREQGVEISPANLKISDRATITMPYHVEQDGLEEARLSKTGAQFGSTKRGIAYAYGDKYMKKTLRMGDLLHLDDAVKKRLVTMVDSKNLVMEGSYNAAPISVDEMWAWLEKYAAIFKDYICDVGQYLADADAAGQEGAVRGTAGRSARHRFRHLPLYHLFQRHRCLRSHRRRHPGPQAAQLHRRHEGLLLLRGRRPLHCRAGNDRRGKARPA